MLKLFLSFVCVVVSVNATGSKSDLKSSYVQGLRDENVRQKRSDDPAPLEAVVSRLSQDVQTLTAKLQAAENTIATQRSDFLSLLNAKGSTFVRWGRSSCPNDSQLLYSGFAAGSHYRDSGSGSNRLCMSPDPVFDNSVHLTYYASLTGIQYWIDGHQGTDVLCAACYTPHSATFMVPGTNRCPAATVLQYHGYLTASQQGVEAQADHVCLDSQPEDHPGSSGDQEPSGFFEHVVTNCAGSLACPPYQNDMIVTCAVCSM